MKRDTQLHTKWCWNGSTSSKSTTHSSLIELLIWTNHGLTIINTYLSYQFHSSYWVTYSNGIISLKISHWTIGLACQGLISSVLKAYLQVRSRWLVARRVTASLYTCEGILGRAEKTLFTAALPHFGECAGLGTQPADHLSHFLPATAAKQHSAPVTAEEATAAEEAGPGFCLVIGVP